MVEVSSAFSAMASGGGGGGQSLAFSISPAKKSKEHNEEEDYYLTLAPFSRAPKINFGEVKINTLVERTLHIFNPQQFEIKLAVSNQDLCINNMEISIDEKSSVDFKIRWQPDKADYYKYSIFFEVVNGARLKFLVHAFGICVAPPPKPTARKPFNMLQPLKKDSAAASKSTSGPKLQPVANQQEAKKPPASTKEVVSTLKTGSGQAKAPVAEKKPFLKARNKENVERPVQVNVSSSSSCANQTTVLSSVTKPSKYTYGTTRAHNMLTSTVAKTKRHRVPIDFYESYTGEDDDQAEPESEEALRRKTCIITTPKVLKKIAEDPGSLSVIGDDEIMISEARFNSTTTTIRRSISVGDLAASPYGFSDATVIMAAGAAKGSEFGSRSVSSSTSNLNGEDCVSPTVSSTLKRPMSLSNPHIAMLKQSGRGEFVHYLEPLDDTPTLLSKESAKAAAAGMDLTPKLCDFTKTAKTGHSATIASTQLIDISACSSHITNSASIVNSTLLYGSTTPRAGLQPGRPNMRLSGFGSERLDPASCYRMNLETPNMLNFHDAAAAASGDTSSDAKEAFSNVTVIVNNRTKDLNDAGTDDEQPMAVKYFGYEADRPELVAGVLACQRAWRRKREHKESERVRRLDLALKSINALKAEIISMDTLSSKGDEIKKVSSALEGGSGAGVVVMNHVEKLKREREHMVHCLVNCQRWLRMKRFRRALETLKRERRLQEEHEHMVACVVTCQRAVRMKRFRARLAVLRHEREVELERRRVETLTRYAVVCQRAVRMKRFRSSVRAIKAENERIRLEIEEQQRRLLKYAIVCQKAVRMKRFRKSLAELRHQRELEIAYQASLLRSTVMIQRAWRMKTFRRRLAELLEIRRQHLELVKYTSVVQRAWRMKNFRRNLLRLREEKRVRDEQERLRVMNLSAAIIQRNWRLYKFRRAMNRYRTSATKIQRWFRVDMKQRLSYLKLRRAVVRLQRLSREYLAVRQAAALKIQACWRMHVERKKYQTVVKSALVIQRWYRSKADRLAYLKLKRAVSFVQARARFVLFKRQKMAVKIQRAFRMYRFRKAMARYRNAAVTIQRWTRGMALRYEYINKLRIILKIQRLYREIYMVRRQSAALKIQRAWRCALARRQLEQLRAAERESRYVNMCATRIQALWRGYWVRKQTDHVLNSIRSRLSVYMPTNLPDSNGASVDNTLGGRIRKSLYTLSCYQEVPIQQMIFALTDLDKVTKLSPECCTTFIQEGAVSILYSFIGNCNRSIPHMDLIRYCLQIFINLAKYHKTVESVLEPMGLALTILSNLFQYYHISNPIIFMDVCVLFILIARSERMVRELNSQSVFIQKLLSLHSILERKTSYTMKRYANIPAPQARHKPVQQQNSNPNETQLSNVSMASLPSSVSNSSICSFTSNGSSATAYAVSNSTCYGSATKSVPSNLAGRTVVFTLEADWVLGTNKTTIELTGQLAALEHLLTSLGIKYPQGPATTALTASTGKTPRKSVSMNAIGEAAATTTTTTSHSKVSRKIIK